MENLNTLFEYFLPAAIPFNKIKYKGWIFFCARVCNVSIISEKAEALFAKKRRLGFWEGPAKAHLHSRCLPSVSSGFYLPFEMQIIILLEVPYNGEQNAAFVGDRSCLQKLPVFIHPEKTFELFLFFIIY